MLFLLALAFGLTSPAANAPSVISFFQVDGRDDVVDTSWSLEPGLTKSELATAKKLGDPFAIVFCTSIDAEGRLGRCRTSSWEGANPLANQLALKAVERARLTWAQGHEYAGKSV